MKVSINAWVVRTILLVFGIGIMVAAGMTVRNIRLTRVEECGSMPAPTQIKLPSGNIYG